MLTKEQIDGLNALFEPMAAAEIIAIAEAKAKAVELMAAAYESFATITDAKADTQPASAGKGHRHA